MGRLLLAVLGVAAGFAAGFGYGRWYGPRGAASSVRQPTGYHCPMHPQVRSDKPGDCGICGMRLVADQATAPPGPPAAGERADLETRHLVPGAVRISPARQQLIGVRFGTVASAAGERLFRAAGKVAVDETRIWQVRTRVDGWVERVFANFTGKAVQKGEPLLTLYSPEMLATQQEYLLALKSREILRASPLESSRRQSESILAAARRRLQLWDLSEEQIRQVETTGKPIENITVLAPASGLVLKRNAFPKQRVTGETELYALADLSRVWVIASVFENEAAQVGVGMPATLTLPFARDRKLRATVSSVQPEVDPMTRTLQVRLEVDNEALLLKPDMFVDVDFRVTLPPRLVVPVDAVLDTGLRQTVFVDRGNGDLEPRRVQTGDRFEGMVEIRQGLRAGERVVISGVFLVDSESQLRSAGGMPSAAAPSPEPPQPAAGRAHTHD